MRKQRVQKTFHPEQNKKFLTKSKQLMDTKNYINANATAG